MCIRDRSNILSAFDKELIGPALTLKNSLLPIILDVILTPFSTISPIATDIKKAVDEKVNTLVVAIPIESDNDTYLKSV